MSRTPFPVRQPMPRRERIVVVGSIVVIAVLALSAAYFTGALMPKTNQPPGPVVVFSKSGPFSSFELAPWYIQHVTGLATMQGQGFSTLAVYWLAGDWTSVNESSMFLLTQAQFGPFFDTVWSHHPSGYSYGIVNRTSGQFNVTIQPNNYTLVFIDLTSSNVTVTISQSIIALPAG